MLCPSPVEGVHAEEATIKTNVTVQPVLGLTTKTNNYVVDITPTETGSFNSYTSTVSVTTNNETGYSLYLTTANGQATLANTEGTATINPVSGTVPAANFTANTWGYNLSKNPVSPSTTYQAVPTQNDDPAGGSETPVDGDTYNLTFGAFINTDLPGGAYTNQVVVSAVANPAYIPPFDGIQTMQEMTSTICANAEVGTTATLTDTRDSNTYTVAKLPDGNCWMTQNLRLSSTTEDGSSRILTSADSNVTRNWTFPTGSLTSGNSYTEARSTISTDPEHALEYGGYYNYCAASAGTVCNDTTAQDATQDICPKGWRLPTLNETEGITNHTSAFSPAYSGLYVSGSLNNTGSYGFWWSATAFDSSRQYYLVYNSGSLNTSYSSKVNGLSVRCIRAS